jgi:hypothetical protein
VNSPTLCLKVKSGEWGSQRLNVHQIRRDRRAKYFNRQQHHEGKMISWVKNRWIPSQSQPADSYVKNEPAGKHLSPSEETGEISRVKNRALTQFRDIGTESNEGKDKIGEISSEHNGNVQLGKGEREYLHNGTNADDEDDEDDDPASQLHREKELAMYDIPKTQEELVMNGGGRAMKSKGLMTGRRKKKQAMKEDLEEIEDIVEESAKDIPTEDNENEEEFAEEPKSKSKPGRKSKSTSRRSPQEDAEDGDEDLDTVALLRKNVSKNAKSSSPILPPLRGKALPAFKRLRTLDPGAANRAIHSPFNVSSPSTNIPGTPKAVPEDTIESITAASMKKLKEQVAEIDPTLEIGERRQEIKRLERNYTNRIRKARKRLEKQLAEAQEKEKIVGPEGIQNGSDTDENRTSERNVTSTSNPAVEVAGRPVLKPPGPSWTAINHISEYEEDDGDESMLFSTETPVEMNTSTNSPEDQTDEEPVVASIRLRHKKKAAPVAKEDELENEESILPLAKARKRKSILLAEERSEDEESNMSAIKSGRRQKNGSATKEVKEIKDLARSSAKAHVKKKKPGPVAHENERESNIQIVISHARKKPASLLAASAREESRLDVEENKEINEDEDIEEPTQPTAKALGKRKAVDVLSTPHLKKRVKVIKDNGPPNGNIKSFFQKTPRSEATETTAASTLVDIVDRTWTLSPPLENSKSSKSITDTPSQAPALKASMNSKPSRSSLKVYKSLKKPRKTRSLGTTTHYEAESPDENAAEDSGLQIAATEVHQPEADVELFVPKSSERRKRRLSAHGSATSSSKVKDSPLLVLDNAKAKRITPKSKAIIKSSSSTYSLTHEETNSIIEAVEDYRKFNGWTDTKLNDVIQQSYALGSRSSLATEFWTSISEELPDIPASKIKFMCRRKYHNFEARGTWTKEQDEELRAVYDANPRKWADIARFINRHPEDVRDRWRNYLICGDNLRKDRWDEEEEYRLKDVVRDCIDDILIQYENSISYATAEDMVDWNKVSKKLDHTRSRLQCSNKWKKIKSKENFSDGQKVRRPKQKKLAFGTPTSAGQSTPGIYDGEAVENNGEGPSTVSKKKSGIYSARTSSLKGKRNAEASPRFDRDHIDANDEEPSMSSTKTKIRERMRQVDESTQETQEFVNAGNGASDAEDLATSLRSLQNSPRLSHPIHKAKTPILPPIRKSHKSQSLSEERVVESEDEDEPELISGHDNATANEFGVKVTSHTTASPKAVGALTSGAVAEPDPEREPSSKVSLSAWNRAVYQQHEKQKCQRQMARQGSEDSFGNNFHESNKGNESDYASDVIMEDNDQDEDVQEEEDAIHHDLFNNEAVEQEEKGEDQMDLQSDFRNGNASEDEHEYEAPYQESRASESFEDEDENKNGDVLRGGARQLGLDGDEEALVDEKLLLETSFHDNESIDLDSPSPEPRDRTLIRRNFSPLLGENDDEINDGVNIDSDSSPLPEDNDNAINGAIDTDSDYDSDISSIPAIPRGRPATPKGQAIHKERLRLGSVEL